MDGDLTNTPIPTDTPAPQEQAAPTPVKKERVAKRNVEDLHNVAPNKMTPAESVDYIKALRAEINQLNQQVQAYAGNAQSAYEKARNLTASHEEYKLKAQAKLNYARQAIEHCRTSIVLAGTLED